MAGSTEYKNQWAKDNLDALRITIPKGTKDELSAVAKAKGFKGYADYIKALVSLDSGVDLERKKAAEE